MRFRDWWLWRVQFRIGKLFIRAGSWLCSRQTARARMVPDGDGLVMVNADAIEVPVPSGGGVADRFVVEPNGSLSLQRPELDGDRDMDMVVKVEWKDGLFQWSGRCEPSEEAGTGAAAVAGEADAEACQAAAAARKDDEGEEARS